MTPNDPISRFEALFFCMDPACGPAGTAPPWRLRYTGEAVPEAPPLGRWACDRCGAIYHRPAPRAEEEGRPHG